MTDSVAVFPPEFRVTDANANVVPGAKIKFFDAGTSTPKTVYSDYGLSTSLGTVVTCLSDGAPANGSSARCQIYVGTDPYKVEFYDADDVLVPGMTFDNVKGAVAVSAASATSLAQFPIDAETADFTIVADDYGKVKDVNTSVSSKTVTLISAVTATNGQFVAIRKNGAANSVTIVPTGGQTINGASSLTLSNDGECVLLDSDGANWKLIANYSPNASAITNTRLEKDGVSYTVTAADNGSTIALTGDSPNTLTFPTPTGFNTAHINIIVNETDYSAGGRSKFIALTGNNETPSFTLKPGQSKIVFLQNSIWRCLSAFERWKPNDSLIVYVDTVSGSDTTGDGLGVGSGSFKTASKAYQFIRDEVDSQGQAPTIKIAGALTESLRITGQPVGTTGTQINFEGDTSNPANVTWTSGSGGFCLAAKDGGIATVKGLKFIGGGSGHGAIVSEGQQSVIDFENVIFGSFSTGYHISAYDGGYINATDSYEISAPGPTVLNYHIFNGGGIVKIEGSITITVTGGMNIGVAFVFAASNNAKVVFGSSITWAGTGVGSNSAGYRYNVSYTAYLDRGTAAHWTPIAASGAPGNTLGTDATQAQVYN